MMKQEFEKIAGYVKNKNDHIYRIEIFDKDNRLVEELEL